MSYTHEPVAHDVVIRVVLTRRVTGDVTPSRRHKLVTALRRMLAHVGKPYGVYHVDVCEIADVRSTR